MGNAVETNVATPEVIEITEAEKVAQEHRDSDLKAHLEASPEAPAAAEATTTDKPVDEWTPNYKLKVLDEEKEIEE